MPVRVCFVCLGNICRSPTAEGVFLGLVERAALSDEVEVDSAGTGAWHTGEPADPRSRSAAARRGIPLHSRARCFTAEDFARFDLVVAMDRQNQRDLEALAPDRAAREKVALLRDFEPNTTGGADVPDPYYGGDTGFDTVLDICEAACVGLLEHLRSRPPLAP
jgi:protein-tyrosine phosphatase